MNSSCPNITKGQHARHRLVNCWPPPDFGLEGFKDEVTSEARNSAAPLFPSLLRPSQSALARASLPGEHRSAIESCG